MSIVFMCIPCRKKAYIPATSVASANSSAHMQLIMMRWGGALGAAQNFSFGPHTRCEAALQCLHCKGRVVHLCIPSRVTSEASKNNIPCALKNLQ